MVYPKPAYPKLVYPKLVYRVLRRAFARAPFDGEGAYLYGGRWSSVGTRLAYTSEHQSLAMLEYFVHLDSDNAPTDLILLTAEIPGAVHKEILSPDDLRLLWRNSPAPAELARFGDEFARTSSHSILVVPSALAPGENNWLINPMHADFAKIKVLGSEPLNYDARMFEVGRRGRKKR